MAGALEMATQYAQQRRAFGGPIADHQGVRWMLADAAARIEAARCLVYASAQRYDAADEHASVHASMAKMHATDLCMKIVVDCLQLFGGNGYLKAYPLERLVRDAKLNQIGEGTSEIHKNVIGRWLLEQAGLRATHPCLELDPDIFCGDA
jgi:alkylation response protein AidB-like acyl-CoA dehydrogenase